MVAGDPGQGGATWAVLQYVLGVRALGHEVLLVEPVDAVTRERASAFDAVCAEFDLQGSAALAVRDTEQTLGLPYATLRSRMAGADLLLNVAGMLTDERLIGEIDRRVYLDLDPAFNQLWHENGVDMRFDLHTHFVTVGLALGRPDCDVPTAGRAWIASLPPVVLARWTCAGTPRRRAFTTVANWRSYGSIEHAGVRYGQKAHSFRRLIGLPRMSRHAYELALAIHPDERDDVAALASGGWRLVDPRALVATPSAYRDFVRSSYAEIGIAKAGYVDSRCGWFGDRSASYLASGRPVLAQDTGFGDALPTGEGLLVFTDGQDAAAAADAVTSEYERHSRAARALAEEHLDSGRVLGRLLERVGGAA
jgi:hypothetical protein